MLEDEAPRPRASFTPPVLDSWGVEDLRGWIATLRAEIARAEAAIEKRQAQRSAAEAFFKKP